MGREFSKKISVEELKDLLLGALRKGFKDEIEGEDEESALESHLAFLTTPIERDLGKVSFDPENQSFTRSYAGYPVGFQQLPSGLTFLGVDAGGDWEFPIFFIIYWDGKKLRGYIPTEGNAWNKVTKKAYGNEDGDQDVDDEERKEEVDVAKILKDIEGRITFRGP